jgi:hypothetical protein
VLVGPVLVGTRAGGHPVVAVVHRRCQWIAALSTARVAPPRQQLRCVPGMLSSLEEGEIEPPIGAVLASMRVTKQIDAMEVSAVNPYKFLAATRVLACIAMLPLLTLARTSAASSWAGSTPNGLDFPAAASNATEEQQNDKDY